MTLAEAYPDCEQLPMSAAAAYPDCLVAVHCWEMWNKESAWELCRSGFASPAQGFAGIMMALDGLECATFRAMLKEEMSRPGFRRYFAAKLGMM
jgi:hypothetical protein